LQSSKNYLRQGKGQDVQSFTKEFRKKTLNLGIALDTPEVITKYIGSLHSYMKHLFSLFEPTTINSANIKEIHIENGKKMKEMIIPKNHHSNLPIQSEMERKGEEDSSSQRRRTAVLQSLQNPK